MSHVAPCVPRIRYLVVMEYATAMVDRLGEAFFVSDGRAASVFRICVCCGQRERQPLMHIEAD